MCKFLFPDIINDIASYLTVLENESIKVLCDTQNTAYSMIDHIEINEYMIESFKIHFCGQNSGGMQTHHRVQIQKIQRKELEEILVSVDFRFWFGKWGFTLETVSN